MTDNYMETTLNLLRHIRKVTGMSLDAYSITEDGYITTEFHGFSFLHSFVMYSPKYYQSFQTVSGRRVILMRDWS